MLGLFGALNMGARSLQTQQQAIAVAGHNLANVNTPAYARQRLQIAATSEVDANLGLQGSGADAVGIQRIRSSVLDGQIVSEASIRGALNAEQKGLGDLDAALGESIDRQSGATDGTSATGGVGGQYGIASGLAGLFNAFQSVSTNPTSLAERQVLILKATDLANRFNSVDQRLSAARTNLNLTLQQDVSGANELMGGIARLNQLITTTEAQTGGVANDLRDVRQQKIEQLSELVQVNSTEEANGSVDLTVGGVTLVQGGEVLDTLQMYDAGGGRMLIQGAASKSPIDVAGGSIRGIIGVRDGELASLKSDINQLAALVITKVNGIHNGGFALNGATGADFFSGTNAGDMKVNADLIGNPALFQASGASGAAGDNTTVLALAQLGNQVQAGLGNQTFSQSYGQTVTGLGQAIANNTGRLSDQKVVDDMLARQRDSVSGVSLDEEMTDLTRFQKAYAASAKLISTLDMMLDDVVNMKR